MPQKFYCIIRKNLFDGVLEVLAEGVETLDQLNFLKKYECGDIQGFYYSKPLSIKELEDYFKNPSKLNEFHSLVREKK